MTDPTGKKYDDGKPRFSLFPTEALWCIIDVLEHGARKYGDDNWRRVDGAVQRYMDAAHRHLRKFAMCNAVTGKPADRLDEESGLPHIAHAIVCLIFVLWHSEFCDGSEIKDGAKDSERIYPCADCDTMRTKEEGGAVFTVCDSCFEKRMKELP